MTPESFFIVGLWSCGTTILAKALDSHPKLQCIYTEGNHNYETESRLLNKAWRSIGFKQPQVDHRYVVSHLIEQLMHEAPEDISPFRDKINQALVNSLNIIFYFYLTTY
jgi:hypothetical protein